MPSNQNQAGRMSPERNRLIQILSHKQVWPSYSLDGKGPELAPRFVDRYIYDPKYKVYLPPDGSLMAIIVEKKTLWLAEAHIAACPECRGAPIRDWAATVKELLKKDGIEKVIGLPSAKNKAVGFFMNELGFRYVATLEGTSKKALELWELDL